MEGNSQAAVEFLQRWEPGGPWVLTAIAPDKKSIRTATFSNEAEALPWIEERNGRMNMYFHVNPCMREMSKKAEREDVRELAWLHVDIDPRVGEDIAEEQRRALGLLQSPPGDVPPPTVIIYSGGGYQGFWRLADPLPINGEQERYEHAKRYNIQLEVLFGADNCHNVDRIMRLPGTVNIPDERKRRKGRTEALAELVEFHDDRVYPLGRFTPSAPVQTLGAPAFGPEGQEIKISGNVDRLSSLDELNRWSIPERVKVIIAQGRHPDEGPKEGDDSRSAWLFDVVCNMMRFGAPDEVIYSVITDPEFAISQSVREKGSNAERYAIKQIASAKEQRDCSDLFELNSRFAVIGNVGGKCRVVEEQEDMVLRRSRLTLQTFTDFQYRLMNQKIEVQGSDGKPRLVELGEWWLKNPRRRQFDRIVFSPSGDPAGAYNLWRGFACDARPGDCGLFLDHVRDNVCAGNEEHFQYLMCWMARLIQQPDSPGQVAVVLRGRMGTGKGVFAKTLGALLGRHYLQISDTKHLVGSFNSHLRDCVLLFADEAFYAGDKRHESTLRALVTEDVLTIEAKGIDAETHPNFLHLILASNSDWVVPAGSDERRFFVLDVGAEHKQDHDYFAALSAQMKTGGREALLHTLMTWDISRFEVRVVPRTSALQEQKELTFSPQEAWWHQKLEEGILVHGTDSAWPDNISKDTLLEDYVQHMRDYGVLRRGNPVTLGRFFKRVCPSMTSWQGRRGATRPYFYSVPPLARARAEWSAVHPGSRWPEVREDQDLPDMSDAPAPF